MRRQPTKKAPVHYQEAVITYLDIMGFRKLVAEREPGHISRILRILKETVKPVTPALLRELYIQHFSDLVVRVLPVIPRPGHSGDLFFELLNLVYLHKSLILEGIFVRGGITFGSIVKSWGLLYGPGLVKAYDLEQCASYPRVIVDHNVLLGELRRNRLLRHVDHDYDTEMEHIGKLIRKDTDGHYFIDYLRAIELEFDNPEIGYPNFLTLHRQHVVTALDKFRFDKKILKKYQWLRAYHNSTVKQRFTPAIAKKYVI